MTVEQLKFLMISLSEEGKDACTVMFQGKEVNIDDLLLVEKAIDIIPTGQIKQFRKPPPPPPDIIPKFL